ncbi:ribonuclease H-like domain-containing protein [Mycena sp. CBHHK59/15]|nr:ribonuclease H-like domain-containing protein [Mycena sp. CBHHK59/15]
MAAIIAEDATGLIAWINNHGKVRKIFDSAQAVISKDRDAGRIIILVYLIANITRWTTHFVAFVRLLLLRDALQLAVLTDRSAIIAAQVGVATSTEGERLAADAERFCALIKDTTFWSGLETVIEDLEPICLGFHPPRVLLTIAGIFLRFADHPEEDVKKLMVTQLEKRWKACDQPAFLAALILNPFENLSSFGPNTNLNQFKCPNLVTSLYRRMMGRPGNPDTPEQRRVKELQVSKAFIQYLSSTGDFIDFDAASWEEIHGNVDPIQVWGAFSGSSHLAELAEFAIMILIIVANQAGCERTFSRTKIEQSDHRNRLGLKKIDKRTKIKADILGYKERKGRKNHKSIAGLLSVPRYRDLLEDQDDEDSSERGRALVSSSAGWRTDMAKWIAATRAAEREELPDSESEAAAEGAAPPRLRPDLQSQCKDDARMG